MQVQKQYDRLPSSECCILFVRSFLYSPETTGLCECCISISQFFCNRPGPVPVALEDCHVMQSLRRSFNSTHDFRLGSSTSWPVRDRVGSSSCSGREIMLMKHIIRSSESFIRRVFHFAPLNGNSKTRNASTNNFK